MRCNPVSPVFVMEALLPLTWCYDDRGNTIRTIYFCLTRLLDPEELPNPMSLTFTVRSSCTYIRACDYSLSCPFIFCIKVSKMSSRPFHRRIARRLHCPSPLSKKPFILEIRGGVLFSVVYGSRGLSFTYCLIVKRTCNRVSYRWRHRQDVPYT